MFVCGDRDECIEDFKQSYNKPGHPIAYSGINKVYDYYKPYLSYDDVENLLAEVESYTLHREFHKSQRNPSYSHFKRYQFQCDLVDIRNLSEFNDGINYILTCIDTFTRYGFARLLRTKEGKVVTDAFRSILREAVTPPRMLVMDRGTEFYNEHFKRFCEENNIRYFPPDSSIHGAYIERFNRTLQSIIYKYMTENETRRFIDRRTENGQVQRLLPLFLQTYNNRRHRMIGTTPNAAENTPALHAMIRENLAKYYETIKKRKVKYNVGDKVRIATLKGKFDRGYNERAKAEVFKVNAVKNNMPIPMYTLSNYRGDEIIKGNFYGSEMTKKMGDVYRVEKVIKRRKRNGKTELFVKWVGFDDSYNSWIDEGEVTRNY